MSTPSRPEVVHHEPASRFVARVEGEEAGYAEYVRQGDVLRATHTVVDPAHGGRGVGSALVAALVDHARTQGLGVLPECSFVQAHLARDPALGELVPVADRARFGL